MAKVQELIVPKLQYAMVDGKGAPESSEEFQNAIAALYGIAYTTKFGRKKAGVGPDYTIGPYDREGPTIHQLEEYAKTHELTFRGKHHEIYLGDPRRAKPEKLRTILRHPVA